MDNKFTKKDIFTIIVLLVGSVFASFFRGYFIWTEVYKHYSILMSFLQGVFTSGIEYIVLKKWVSNKKVLIAVIVSLLVIYTTLYALKITGVI